MERKGERLDFLFFYLAMPGLGCGTWDLYLRHAGSSSLTRGLAQGPLRWARSLGHWTTSEVPRLDSNKEERKEARLQGMRSGPGQPLRLGSRPPG